MDAIILAAGNSKRFGSNKLLHEINGKPMYRYILENIEHLRKLEMLEHVVVVSQYDEILEQVKKAFPKIQRVKNEHSDWGIAHSISLGIQYVSAMQCVEEKQACLFAVSDQPYLRLQSLQGFVEAYQKSTKGIGICSHENHMGNPVIFDEKYYAELARMEGDKGGKQVVMQYLEDTFLYPVGREELEDIDVRGNHL